MCPTAIGSRHQCGLTYVGLLFVVAALSLAGAATVRAGAAVQRAQAEDELLFVGAAYRNALRSWRDAGSKGGQADQAPRSLEDLLLDTRSQRPLRHLRRLYPDPLSGRVDWAVVRDAQGGILGVHSRSTAAPLRRDGFPSEFFFFRAARQYRQWLFVWGVPCTDSGCVLPAGGSS